MESMLSHIAFHFNTYTWSSPYTWVKPSNISKPQFIAAVEDYGWVGWCKQQAVQVEPSFESDWFERFSAVSALEATT